MSSSLSQRIWLIVLALAAIGGWIAFLNVGGTDEQESKQAVAVLEQELTELQADYNDLQSDYEGLLEENVALRTLSEARSAANATTAADDGESMQTLHAGPSIIYLPGGRENYLEKRLKYASKQLQRLRAQSRKPIFPETAVDPSPADDSNLESIRTVAVLEQELTELQAVHNDLRSDYEDLLQEATALRTSSEDGRVANATTAVDDDESAPTLRAGPSINHLPVGREDYLEKRLEYASRQLRRLRTENRQLSLQVALKDTSSTDGSNERRLDATEASSALDRHQFVLANEKLATRIVELNENFNLEREYYERAIKGLTDKLNQAVSIITTASLLRDHQPFEQSAAAVKEPQAESVNAASVESAEAASAEPATQQVTGEVDGRQEMAPDPAVPADRQDAGEAVADQEMPGNEAAESSRGAVTDDSAFLRDRINQLERDLKGLREALLAAGKHSAELQKADNRIVSLIQQLKMALDKNDRMRIELQNLDDRVELLTTELANAEKRNQNMEIMANAIIEENEHLGELIDNLRDNMNLTIAEKLSEISKIRSGYAVIEYSTDVLFESGSAVLSEEGKQALSKFVASIDQDAIADRLISVEGHTDSIPIAGDLIALFPSNWELSTARAASATRFLVDQGLVADRLRSVGFSSLRPTASNDTADGRAANRRIEIHLVPDLR